jgi:hypothetical protein
MEQILDSEMPTRRDRRRWLWLLLLLLLIGICNYHRLGFWSSGPSLTSATKVTTATGGHASAGGSGGEGGHVSAAGNGGAGTRPATGQPAPGLSLAQIVVNPGRTGSTPNNAPPTTMTPDTTATTMTPDTTATTTTPDTMAGNPDIGVGNPDNATPTVTKADTTKAGAAKPDTASKKGVPAKAGTPKKPNKAQEKYRGFAVAIGFNQFFPLGQQVTSDLNSSGAEGQLSDYLPIPQVRYYFNKKVYVQVEAQFNTPQYTSKNLALKNSILTTDTSYVYNRANGTTQSYPIQTDSSAYIRKLFYFNMPVSVHYSPLKNVWVGTGIQYSKLTNGVALYENERLANAVLADSLELSKLETLKGSTLYSELKSHEFRLLFDANYQWKGFMFGLRYNQALSKFIDLKLGPSTVVQARNSSLQLYIRYTIWRQRSLKDKK